MTGEHPHMPYYRRFAAWHKALTNDPRLKELEQRYHPYFTWAPEGKVFIVMAQFTSPLTAAAIAELLGPSSTRALVEQALQDHPDIFESVGTGAERTYQFVHRYRGSVA